MSSMNNQVKKDAENNSDQLKAESDKSKNDAAAMWNEFKKANTEVAKADNAMKKAKHKFEISDKKHKEAEKNTANLGKTRDQHEAEFNAANEKLKQVTD